MSEWDQHCQQWLVDTGWCVAGGLATVSDGNLYAAYPSDRLWQGNHTQEIPKLEGGTEQIQIDEPTTLWQAINEGRCEHGLWIAGEKYTVVGKDQIENFTCIFAAKKAGGCHIVCTPKGNAVIAIYDEALEHNSPNARQVAMAFAQYLQDNDY